MNLPAQSTTDSRARPEPNTFFPPKLNAFVVRMVQAGIRRSIRRKLKVTDIEIDDQDLECLRKLKGQRCMVTPSHSGGFEPHIIMYLSKLLGDCYHYIAAMELFQQSIINRILMPRMGVYSVIRGAVDRPSFSMTRKLLAEGKRWLVVFPEGETVWQNGVVIPFQQGVLQLAFKGFEDAGKAEAEPHLYCVPIAIKYVYLQEMYTEIDESLSRLESKLDLGNESDSLSRYQRLRRIAESVVAANEKSLGFQAPPDSSLDDRAQQLKAFAASQLESQLGITPSKRHSLMDRIRTLFNTVDRIVHEEATGSEYEQQLAAERQQTMREHYDDLWRLLRFVTLHDGYVAESMTVERFMDVLCLMEMEVCGERRIWGPRKARVKVGDPIDLADHAAAYKDDRRGVVKSVTDELESSVRSMLEELERDCRNVAEDA